MIVQFLFHLLLMVEPTQGREIILDNRKQYLPTVGYNRVLVAKDGTFLALSRYQLWHWDQDGNIINVIGRKGEAPGEFGFLGEAIWDGRHYWIIDGYQLRSSVFDRSGRYLSTSAKFFRQLIRVDDRLFAIDLSQFDAWRSQYPPVLKEINYNIANNQLNISETGMRFKKVSKRQMELRFNFKLVWVVQEGDTYLVVDQLEPKIWVYDNNARQTEAGIAVDKPFEPNFRPMQVKYWVEPPKRLEKKRSQSEHLVYWNSWSRINYFGRLGDAYVLAYNTPDEEDEYNSVQVIQRIAKDGRALGDPILANGFIMGSKDNKVFLFSEGDNEDEFVYLVRTLNL